ncbi:MAG: hypothetical protein Q8Q03_02245 [bacterium]|nr:hypothetical protein [bacterium]
MNTQKGIAPIIIALIVAVILGGGYAVVKTNPSIAQKLGIEKVEKTEVANASITTSTITDAEARAQLQTANMCNYPAAWSRSDCVNHPEPQTSLEGIHQAVLTEVISFKNACDAWTGSGGTCNVGVTGGTETSGGHVDASCSHISGDKVDISNTASVNAYILAKDSAGKYVNFTQMADRHDAGGVITPQFKNNTTGVTYAKEPTHWDIGGVGCTK